MSAYRLPPIFFFALCAAAGVLTADALRPPAFPVLGALLVFVTLLVVASRLSLPARKGAAPSARRVSIRDGPLLPLLPYALFFAVGLFVAALFMERLESGPLRRAALEGRESVVSGRVAREPIPTDRGTLIEIAVDEVSLDGETFRTSETARVICSSSVRLESGQRVAVYGRPAPAGGRDPTLRERFLHKGVSAQLSVTSGRIELLETRVSGRAGLVNEVRSRLKRGVSRNLDAGSAGLLVGVILGDTRGIDPEIAEDFQATGLSHVLAVSGLNVMFLVGAAWIALKVVRASPTLQVAGLSAVIWFYVLLAEGSPSILRAAIMAEVALVAWITGRRKDAVASVSLAFLALIIVQPFSLFDLGFQLSFAATLSLILLTPIIADKFKNAPKALVLAAATCLAAQLGVFPVLASAFGRLSLASLPANMVVVPASAPALDIGVLAAAVEYVSPALAAPLYRLAGLFVGAMISTARFFGSIPASSIPIPAPGLVEIIVYYALLIAGAALFAKWRGRLSLVHLILVILLPLTMGIAWQVSLSRHPTDTEITFLDIGQGDATLIREPGGATLLVDAGPDAGVISSILARKGVRRVDMAVLSHAHADHSAGFEGVFRAAGVARLLLHGGRSSSLAGLEKEARSRGVPVEKARPGATYKLGSLTIEVVEAGSEGEGEGEGENNRSLVLRITKGDFSVLLPGDVEEEAERALAVGGDIGATVLKVPHHGGATASDDAFLKAVAPKVSVISVGKNNRYGMPSRVALDRLAGLGSYVFRTDRDGSVTIQTDGKMMKAATER